MLAVTIDEILNFDPCREYTRERIEKLFDGRQSITPEEISNLAIPSNDILWVLSKILWYHSPYRANKISRKIALDVVDFWDCPDIVWWCLMTGDASYRIAACAADRAADRAVALEKYIGWFLEVM